VSAPVDVDQLAALRALRRGFGDVQVLKVVKAREDPLAATDQPSLFPTNEGSQ
jgi:hypothetical protein